MARLTRQRLRPRHGMAAAAHPVVVGQLDQVGHAGRHRAQLHGAALSGQVDRVGGGGQRGGTGYLVHGVVGDRGCQGHLHRRRHMQRPWHLPRPRRVPGLRVRHALLRGELRLLLRPQGHDPVRGRHGRRERGAGERTWRGAAGCSSVVQRGYLGVGLLGQRTAPVRNVRQLLPRVGCPRPGPRRHHLHHPRHGQVLDRGRHHARGQAGARAHVRHGDAVVGAPHGVHHHCHRRIGQPRRQLHHNPLLALLRHAARHPLVVAFPHHRGQQRDDGRQDRHDPPRHHRRRRGRSVARHCPHRAHAPPSSHPPPRRRARAQAAGQADDPRPELRPLR
mmetsp:Transcript_16947/g.40333  ORF Transcript_16947/g.40333 Transcript_16947/m.40333 type:complete len:334 (-) Transcript_16947:840-1841(-)